MVGPEAHLVLRRCIFETSLYGIDTPMHNLVLAQDKGSLLAEDVAVVARVKGLAIAPSLPYPGPTIGLVAAGIGGKAVLRRCSVQAVRGEGQDLTEGLSREDFMHEMKVLCSLVCFQGGTMQLVDCRLHGAQMHIRNPGTKLTMRRCLLEGSRAHAALVLSAGMDLEDCHLQANEWGVRVSAVMQKWGRGMRVGSWVERKWKGGGQPAPGSCSLSFLRALLVTAPACTECCINSEQQHSVPTRKPLPSSPCRSLAWTGPPMSTSAAAACKAGRKSCA